MNYLKKLSLLLLGVIVISCSNDDVTDDLQSQIDELEAVQTELEATIETLQGTISTLQGNLQTANNTTNSLSGDLDEAETALAAAQAALNEARALVDDATSDINDLQAALVFVNNALEGINYNNTVNLEATGSVASQNVSQAKQTINGKWNIAASSSKFHIDNKGACSFDFIEFMDDSYLLSIVLPDGEKGRLFGEYILNEGTEGVESVDLMYDIGASTMRVARLTNIVVTQDSDDALSASFDVNLTLPEALEVCQASLPASVSAPKVDPVPEAVSDETTAVSNHARLIGEWTVVGLDSGDGGTLQSALNNFCLGEVEVLDDNGNIIGYQEVQIEGCTPPTGGVINFSNFGTYSTTLLNSDGSVFAVDIEDWSWDNDQTVLVLGFDGEFDRFDIVELTETRLQFRGTYFEEYEDESGQRQEIQITETITCVRQ